MVANHGGSPSGRLIGCGGRGSPDRVVGRWELVETVRFRDVFRVLLGGAEGFRVAEPLLAGPLLAEELWLGWMPRLFGRLPADGVAEESDPSTAIGSLALRGFPNNKISSSPFVSVRARCMGNSRPRCSGEIGAGLAVDMGIRDELFRSPGLRYILDVLSVTSSAAISSGLRRSQPRRSSSVTSPVSSPSKGIGELACLCCSSRRLGHGSIDSDAVGAPTNPLNPLLSKSWFLARLALPFSRPARR